MEKRNRRERREPGEIRREQRGYPKPEDAWRESGGARGEADEVWSEGEAYRDSGDEESGCQEEWASGEAGTDEPEVWEDLEEIREDSRPEPIHTAETERTFRKAGSRPGRTAPGTGESRRGKQEKTVLRRIGRVLMTGALSLVLLVSAGAAGFLILQASGKNSLYSEADSSTLVSTLSGMAVQLGEEPQTGPEAEEDGSWQEGDIRYNGLHYRYNEDILTFLFLGIDKMEEVARGEDGIDGGQSDALFLLVLNPHEKKISVIGIPRDTMTEIEANDGEGGLTWTTRAQITLQHGYGDGGELSCERSVKAVSNLFYGLPVHGYCAVNMGAIPVLNDAVGGVTLTALETLDFGDRRVLEGEEIHLEGENVYAYIHSRDTSSFNSAGRRLQRQVQYLEAYAAAALETFRKDITFPVTLYGKLSRYMVTDITVDEVGYLAAQAAGYGFRREDMHTLEGETRMGEVYEEFYADEKALYELILEVFYEEV